MRAGRRGRGLQDEGRNSEKVCPCTWYMKYARISRAEAVPALLSVTITNFMWYIRNVQTYTVIVELQYFLILKHQVMLFQ